MSPPAAALALAAVLAAAHGALHRQRFRSPGSGRGDPYGAGRRGARHRRWMRRAATAFALPVILVLAMTGRLDALWRLPPEFLPLRDALPAMPPGDLVTGAAAGLALGLVAAAIRARRGAHPIGRPGVLMPRRRDELPWGAAVAITAGVTEEPFFRLLVPLLIAQATGSAAAGFALSTLIFAALHRYQGWRGIIATGLLGTVLAAMYLMSGALWLAVAIHAIVDINGLVLWPALRREG